MLDWAAPFRLKQIVVFRSVIIRLCHLNAIIQERFSKVQLCNKWRQLIKYTKWYITAWYTYRLIDPHTANERLRAILNYAPILEVKISNKHPVPNNHSGPLTAQLKQGTNFNKRKAITFVTNFGKKFGVNYVILVENLLIQIQVYLSRCLYKCI